MSCSRRGPRARGTSPRPSATTATWPSCCRNSASPAWACRSLFGFLLSLPFTNRFAKLSHGQRELYLLTLVLASVSTALLLGPVAYHRLVFRRQQKEGLVRAANLMAILGLVCVGLAVSAAVLLVSSFVATGLTAWLITAFVLVMFGGLWFAFPLTRRCRRVTPDVCRLI